MLVRVAQTIICCRYTRENSANDAIFVERIGPWLMPGAASGSAVLLHYQCCMLLQAAPRFFRCPQTIASLQTSSSDSGLVCWPVLFTLQFRHKMICWLYKMVIIVWMTFNFYNLIPGTFVMLGHTTNLYKSKGIEFRDSRYPGLCHRKGFLSKPAKMIWISVHTKKF